VGRHVALPEYYYKRKEKGKQKRGGEKKISFHYILFYVEGGVFLEMEKQLNTLWNSLYREKYAIRMHGNADPACRAVFSNSFFPWNPFALKKFFYGAPNKILIGLHGARKLVHK
jgi:hypothetical protein